MHGDQLPTRKHYLCDLCGATTHSTGKHIRKRRKTGGVRYSTTDKEHYTYTLEKYKKEKLAYKMEDK